MRNIYCCALIAAALSAGVTGCVPYASNYAPKEVSFKKPPLNVSTTAWVGVVMIADGKTFHNHIEQTLRRQPTP